MNKNLAINGGSPVRSTPWPTRHHFGIEEKKAANELFDKTISSGDMYEYNEGSEELFCAEFAASLGGGFADGVNSGTNAVYIALKAIGIQPGDEVIVGPITDAGGMMPIVVCNAIPVVADTAKNCFNTNASAIAKCITFQTRAILIPHIAGEPVNMVEVMKLARQHNLKVVEDCAQAHGAKFNGKFIGTFGDAAAFSLMGGKHTCAGGQGGMVFTKNEDIYWKIRQFADRGKPFGIEGESFNVVPSLNFNMDELQAIIGRIQWRKLPEIVNKRRAFVKLLIDKGFNELKTVCIPAEEKGAESSYWFLRLAIDPQSINCSKDDFLAAVKAEGLNVIPKYRALPTTFPWFQNRSNLFPWNGAFCHDNSGREFELKNAKETLNTLFILFFNENFGNNEANDIITSFKKVEDAYAI